MHIITNHYLRNIPENFCKNKIHLIYETKKTIKKFTKRIRRKSFMIYVVIAF